jgi:hypothetical protein
VTALLVPIHLDVLVIDTSKTSLAWLKVDYSGYANGDLTTDPLGQPFVGDTDAPPFSGRCAILHWALPDALTHGKQLDDGSIVFPRVPNRWLIVRFDPSNPASARSWVVQSDYCDPTQGTSPFIDPKTSVAGAPVLTRIGRHLDLTTWDQQTSDPGNRFLTVVGPGNVVFSAFAPFCQDVFAFIDEELPASGKLSYLVVGWYSDADEDPLHVVAQQSDLTALLNANSWVLADTSTDLPTSSLYHACACEVDVSATDPLALDPIQVVVANTSTEAVAQLVAQAGASQGNTSAGTTLQQLIEAASYGLLDALAAADGRTRLAAAMHSHSFGAHEGGTIWSVASQGAAADNDGLDSLTDAQRQAIATRLAQLNLQQSQLDANGRELEAKRARLFHLFWDSQYMANWQPGSDGGSSQDGGDGSGDQSSSWGGDGGNGGGGSWDPSNTSTLDPSWNGSASPDDVNTWVTTQLDLSQPSSLAATLWAAAWSYEQDRAKLPSTQAAAADKSSLFGSLPSPSGALTESLVSLGLELRAHTLPRFHRSVDPIVLLRGARRSSKHGQDGALACRLSADTLRPSTGGPTLPSLSSKLPAEIGGLWLEAIVGDPGKPTSGLTGTQPAAFALSTWSQPWSPVFLEWAIDTYPTGSLIDGAWRYQSGDWSFDGNDFVWRGTGQCAASAVSASGRAVLGGGAAAVFADKLRSFLAKHPELDDSQVEQLLTTIEGWDLLAQACDGLTDKLLTQVGSVVVPPPSSGNPLQDPATAISDPSKRPLLGDLIGNACRTAPVAIDSNGLFPVRAAMCELTNLRLLDCFGQMRSLQGATDGNYEAAPSLTPATATGLPQQSTASAFSPFFQLPPRLCQPARLSFELLSAKQPTTTLALSDSPDPLCGWLLPNHLDGGLAIYNADGSFALEIEPSDRGGVPPSLPAGADPTLAAVVAALIARRDDSNNILAVIDETGWLVDPLGDRTDGMLSVLVGRPLALVRARLTLTLDGPPAIDQRLTRILDANKAIRQDTAGVETLTFEVRLGDPARRDDGLIGYFLANDTSVFHAVHVPASVTGDSFIGAVAPGSFVSCPLGVSSPPACVDLILLVDPRGKVHASTGILPVATLELPAHTLARLADRLCVQFRAGPCMGDVAGAPIPVPAVTGGSIALIVPNHPEFTVTREQVGLPTSPRVLWQGHLTLIPDPERV